MKLHRIFLSRLEDWSQKRPLSILGPTGSGKTSTLLAHLRATGLKPLIVSLDSVAAYQELDIGSSKPMGADFSDFDWRGINILPPTQKVNASLLKNAVLPSIEESQRRQQPLVFIGGTHFYERFILEGPAPGAASDEAFAVELAVAGKEKVLEQLRLKDSRWGDFLHLNDEYRILRYGDLVLRQGLTFDVLREGSQNALFPELECLVLNPDKEVLAKKLRLRIDEMLEMGWIKECETLLKKYGSKIPALATIGYAEIVRFLESENRQNLDALKEEIFIRHRQLAKQQRTWLRSLLAPQKSL